MTRTATEKGQKPRTRKPLVCSHTENGLAGTHMCRECCRARTEARAPRHCSNGHLYADAGRDSSGTCTQCRRDRWRADPELRLRHGQYETLRRARQKVEQLIERAEGATHGLHD